MCKLFIMISGVMIPRAEEVGIGVVFQGIPDGGTGKVYEVGKRGDLTL